MIRGRQGFILPVILVLLLVSTIGGMAAASMATLQARGSGRLGASVAGLHAVEAGGSIVVNRFADGVLQWLPNGEYSGAALAALGGNIPVARPGSPNHGDALWWVESMEFQDNSVVFRITSEIPGIGSSRSLEVTYAQGTPNAVTPFGNAVVGCTGVNLAGSGRIDSYDSRQGAYNQNTARANADVSTIAAAGHITLPGSTLIRGNVSAFGNLTMSGSATVQGFMQALGNVIFQGNPTCPANPVEAGGSITRPGAWWCPAAILNAFSSNVTPPNQQCDPLGVNVVVVQALNDARPTNPADFQSGNFNGWQASPINLGSQAAFSGGFQIGAGNTAFFTTVPGGTTDVFVQGNFTTGGGATVRIENPAAVGPGGLIRLFVDGNLTLGGGSSLIIESGAALEIYITGTVNIGGGLMNQNNSPTLTFQQNGQTVTRPSFAIYSSFNGANGVRVGGNTQLFASVYAPLTSVSVEGSGGLYGSVRGATVNVTGAGGIHYDEALGGVSQGATVQAGAPRITAWTVDPPPEH